MELPETFTLIKKNIMAATNLSDKDKLKVCHILKMSFKQCLSQDKADEMPEAPETDSSGLEALKSIFGDTFK